METMKKLLKVSIPLAGKAESVELWNLFLNTMAGFKSDHVSGFARKGKLEKNEREMTFDLFQFHFFRTLKQTNNKPRGRSNTERNRRMMKRAGSKIRKTGGTVDLHTPRPPRSAVELVLTNRVVNGLNSAISIIYLLSIWRIVTESVRHRTDVVFRRLRRKFLDKESRVTALNQP